MRVIWFLLVCCFAGQSVAGEKLRIYIDADYSMARPAAEAIELGVRTAMSDVANRVGNFEIEIVPKDHRANSKRSYSNLRAFTEDPTGIAVIGGVHSPPYLTHRQDINESGIPLLLPWSAAGPITRPDDDQLNWIFRLSVDDTKAGPFLVGHALNNIECEQTVLLLVDTGWGRANRVTMGDAFQAAGVPAPVVFMFSSSLGPASARTIAEKIKMTNADCAIMLSRAREGALLVNELHQQSADIRIISHWGILSGDFVAQVPHSVRSDLQIEVLQTCGLEVEGKGRAELVQALKNASTEVRPFKRLSDVPAATGFVHGYDLTRLLIAALSNAMEMDGWADGSIVDRRNLFRSSLENLSEPVEGILKTYNRPFAPYSDASQDAHEALGLQDLCVVSFSESGQLVLSETVEPHQ
ncbi:ABC transporter substrate-binding protein [uncultured Roseobacter sp.]|uniref:ABC transporter substrate-binding protein n=1 Tax=uncultured Roseobacter sp. TaxID=114847 RepID=UPI00261C6031|nr:ABC transporter substrate-binding protein [uncultured Roseobacter sp.]